MTASSRAAARLPAKRFEEVADGIVAVVHGDGTMGLANSALVLDGAEALVVDTMLLPEMARDLVGELTRRGARPAAVLNTHFHVDHVGGNALFRGVPLVAHPTAAGIVSSLVGRTAELRQLVPRFGAELSTLDVQPPEPALASFVPPRGAQVLVRAPAHSPADVALWFPAERVLVAGDLSFNRVVPLAVHGEVSAWVAALDDLVALEPVTVLAGHGPPATVEDLRALRQYLAGVLAAARLVHLDGVPEAAALAAVNLSTVEGWAEPGRSVPNLRRALRELRGDPDRHAVP